MRKMFARLIENYGYLTAIIMYIRFLLNQNGKMRVPGIKHPVIFRPKTVDCYSLKEIFFFEEYKIDFPVRVSDPLFIIDAGANIGFTSVYFANKYPNSTIIAVEPEAGNFEIILKNVKHYPNITAKPVALWSRRALIEVKDRGYGLRGFIVEEADMQAVNTIEALSIMDLMGDREVIDILKMDIEGSEKEVFSRNYDQWLPHVRCLVVEVHDHLIHECSKTLLRALSQYNFSCFPRGENLCFINQKLIYKRSHGIAKRMRRIAMPNATT